MKKRNWISILLIFLCLAALMGYRTLDRIQTDRVSPVITAGEELPEFSALDPREALLRGMAARDDRDGDVTASLVVESIRLLEDDGTASVTYAAFDRAGNVAKYTREVRFADYEAPRFQLNQPLMFSQKRSEDILGAISASDMLDGNISHRIRAMVLEDADSDVSGNYDVRFTVTNSLGDTVELVLPVKVYTPGMYEGTLSLTKYLVYLEKGTTFSEKQYLQQVVLGREEYDLTGRLPEGMKLTISGYVNTDVPGVYEVEYRITYDLGTELVPQVHTAHSKLVVVVEG